MSIQLQFDPSVGIVAPQVSEIREYVAAQFRAAFSSQGDQVALNTDPTSPAGQLIDALTAEIAAKNDQIVLVSNQMNPKVASGRWQDALGKIYFMTRKIAESTVVVCQCRGLRGTVIPYGAQVATSDGYTLMSTTATGLVIGDSGMVEGPFRVTETGPIEIRANTVTQIKTVVAGWESVNNSAAGSTGRNEESRSEFEARRYNSVAINGRGSVASIYAGIAELPGVLDCKVLENRGSTSQTQFGTSLEGHSVAVCVYGGEDGAIAQALYERLGAGCGLVGNSTVSYTAKEYASATYSYKIIRPSTVAFKVKVTLDGSVGFSVKDAIKRAIIDDFNGANSSPKVGLAQVVYASRFYTAILPNVGSAGLLSVEIALGTGSYGSSLTVNATQEPTISSDDIQITGG